jgi:hypothetical protein
MRLGWPLLPMGKMRFGGAMDGYRMSLLERAWNWAPTRWILSRIFGPPPTELALRECRRLVAIWERDMREVEQHR